MEESIGYESFFSPEEWDAIRTGDWSNVPDDWDPANQASPEHPVDILDPPGQYEGNEERYELECALCDYIGAADTLEQAQVIAKLHESFVATLVENWSVDR